MSRPSSPLQKQQYVRLNKAIEVGCQVEIEYQNSSITLNPYAMRLNDFGEVEVWGRVVYATGHIASNHFKGFLIYKIKNVTGTNEFFNRANDMKFWAMHCFAADIDNEYA